MTTTDGQSVSTTAEGHVVAVLAELADRAGQTRDELERTLALAEHVRASITETMDRLAAAKTRLKQTRSDLSDATEARDNAIARAAEAGEVIARAERRLRELNDMLDAGIEDEQLLAEMGRANKARADKQQEREKWRTKGDEAERKARDCEALLVEIGVEMEARAIEVKRLQRELPDPHLFAWLGLAHIGRANAHYLLGRDASAFDRTLRDGVAVVHQMHDELRQGRYRLDRYGDLLAGRHEATVQAMYAAVAIGDQKLAGELFALAADPSMFFHQIFNVFRVWALGAYVLGDRALLQQLLRDHRYDRNLWSGYVRCFRALTVGGTGAQREFNNGLSNILKLETRPEDLGNIAGVQLVHLPALAFCRLAASRKIPVTVQDRRLPASLLRW